MGSANEFKDAESVQPPRVKKSTHVAIGVGFLLAAATPIFWTIYKQNVAEQVPITEAQTYIKTLLSDPFSAEFRNSHTSGGCVLGEVNAKNKMGGYVGFAGFYYNMKSKTGAVEPMESPKGVIDVERLEAGNTYMAGRLAC